MRYPIDVIKENLESVQSRIEQAAMSAGRRIEDVRLVVVSKSQPVEKIQAAVDTGARNLGENYPQEAVKKIVMVHGGNLEWHMIGHLQSRKAGLVAEYFHYFHALDHVDLAEKLNSHLFERSKTMPTLLEVNVGGESTKSGWRVDTDKQWDEFVFDIEKITFFHNVRICGLMTMPPYSEIPEASRAFFIKLRGLRDKLRNRFPDIDWHELSMGTSMDFEVAIQEGATMVRIGQAILGPRLYRNM